MFRRVLKNKTATIFFLKKAFSSFDALSKIVPQLKPLFINLVKVNEVFLSTVVD